MQRLVGIEVVAGHTRVLVDADHLGMLRHGRLKIEGDTGVVLVQQSALRDRAGINPPEVLGTTEQDIAQGTVIVVYTPSCGVRHGLSARALASIDRPMPFS